MYENFQKKHGFGTKSAHTHTQCLTSSLNNKSSQNKSENLNISKTKKGKKV